MSQISQLSKLTISVAVCITAGVPHTTSPVPQQPNLLLADTFVTKARFYHFFLHQTQSKYDGSVREKARWTLFNLSPVLDVVVRPSTRELVRMWLWSAVIGSGAHMTMVAKVDNASGICKGFMK